VRCILTTAKAMAPYWYAFFLTAYAAGLRRMEVIALRAEHIDRVQPGLRQDLS